LRCGTIPTDTDDFGDEDVVKRVRDAVVGAIERHNSTADGVLVFYKAIEVDVGIYGFQFGDGLAVACAAAAAGKIRSFPSYAGMCVFCAEWHLHPIAEVTAACRLTPVGHCHRRPPSWCVLRSGFDGGQVCGSLRWLLARLPMLWQPARWVGCGS